LPSQVTSNASWFPAIQSVIEELVGDSYEAKEEWMRILFSSFDPHCSDRDDWRQPFQQNKKWQSIERKISQHCATLVRKCGFHLCVDDDKLSNRL
jgi:hypothetical protein